FARMAAATPPTSSTFPLLKTIPYRVLRSLNEWLHHLLGCCRCSKALRAIRPQLLAHASLPNNALVT
ncbi:MAG: hypothetical protein ACK55I_30650, partial [bacterium]